MKLVDALVGRPHDKDHSILRSASGPRVFGKLPFGRQDPTKVWPRLAPKRPQSEPTTPSQAGEARTPCDHILADEMNHKVLAIYQILF